MNRFRVVLAAYVVLKVVTVVDRNSFRVLAFLLPGPHQVLVVEAPAAALYSDSTAVLHPSNSQLQLSLLPPPAPTPTMLVI